MFKSIALGVANGHHLAQFAEGPQLFQIITQHIGDLVTGSVAEPDTGLRQHEEGSRGPVRAGRISLRQAERLSLRGRGSVLDRQMCW